MSANAPFWIGLIVGLLIGGGTFAVIWLWSEHTAGEMWRELWKLQNPGKDFDYDQMSLEDRAIYRRYFATNFGPN